MRPVPFSLAFGRAVQWRAVATFATLVTGILLFTVSQRFGKINETASVLQMLFMIPIAVGLFLLARPYGAALALVATAVGIIGMLITAVLQVLLVLGAVEVEQTISAVLAAGGGVGLWLLSVSLLGISAKALSSGPRILGAAVGVGYILSVVRIHLGREQHPLFYSGALLLVLAYSAWAVWLGTRFLSGRVIVPG
jgi:hypothetical protein